MPPMPPTNTVEVSLFYDGKTDQTSDWPQHLKYTCAVANIQGGRDYMEDSHVLLAPFDQVHGQGFFAVFDGHGGSHAADLCGKKFHKHLRRTMKKHPTWPILDILEETYRDVDAELCPSIENSEGEYAGEDDSGCTAVTAFLRIEDHDGKQPFLRDSNFDSTVPHTPTKPNFNINGTAEHKRTKTSPNDEQRTTRRSSKVQEAAKSSSRHSFGSDYSTASNTATLSNVFTPSDPNLCRVLYCANAGDSRGVLCRGGQAIRLTEDHNTKNEEEVKRVKNARCPVFYGRVCGTLAVTRSLGDPPVKYYFKNSVLELPHTTRTELHHEDEFLILASDGLWDTVEDQEAVDLIRDVKDPKAAADKLIERASTKGSGDNITVVVIRLRDPPVTAPSGRDTFDVGGQEKKQRLQSVTQPPTLPKLRIRKVKVYK